MVSYFEPLFEPSSICYHIHPCSFGFAPNNELNSIVSSHSENIGGGLHSSPILNSRLFFKIPEVSL